jgi:hypothetical protein
MVEISRNIAGKVHLRRNVMNSQEILEKVARGMVATGVYKDITTAIQALAVEQVERKIAVYRKQVQSFEGKYNRSLEEHSRMLAGKASIPEEEDWMEWKGAAVMLDAWQSALRELISAS